MTLGARRDVYCITMETIEHHIVAVDEYLRSESTSDRRHEYVDGVLYAQASASRRHNHIVVNIARHIGPVAEQVGRQLMVADVTLRVTERIFYYPDIMVVCDPTDNDPLIASKPCLVMEVLSPATQEIDRREKLFAYRQLASLEQYLIIAQDEPLVECWSRADAAHWQMIELRGAGAIPLSCPTMEFTFGDMYRGAF
jgi:Uma2 family endonuclease